MSIKSNFSQKKNRKILKLNPLGAGPFWDLPLPITAAFFESLFWSPKIGKCERAARARARVDCYGKRHFKKVNQHGMERRAFYAGTLKTHRPEGINF